MRNLVLIGMMGSGKTTLGRAVAAKLRFAFVDTDDAIEKSAGMSIPHIFEQYGEPRFRTLESAVAERVAAYRETVIATGGGIVTVPGNMQALRRTGFVVYLRCPPEILYERTRTDINRPLLAGVGDKAGVKAGRTRGDGVEGGVVAGVDGSGEPERLTRLRAILAEREALYRRYSDFTLDCGGDEVSALAGRMMEVFAK